MTSLFTYRRLVIGLIIIFTLEGCAEKPWLRPENETGYNACEEAYQVDDIDPVRHIMPEPLTSATPALNKETQLPTDDEVAALKIYNQSWRVCYDQIKIVFPLAPSDQIIEDKLEADREALLIRLADQKMSYSERNTEDFDTIFEYQGKF